MARGARERASEPVRARVVADVEAQLGWIGAIDPLVNAIVVRDDHAAREMAQRVDPTRRLGGVPVVVNETLGVAGLPQSLGRPELGVRAAPVDAPVVRRLRAANAVILGLTNGPSPSGEPDAINAVYGRTLNPRDGRRMAGGRAAGDAAAVAVGLAPLALTTGDAGDVVRAAGWCGVAAHRPSSADYAIVARTVADLEWAWEELELPAVPELSPQPTVRQPAAPTIDHAAALAKCEAATGGALPPGVRLAPAPGCAPPRVGARRLRPSRLAPVAAPITVVTVDTDAYGLPIAVAVVGPLGGDALTLGVAGLLEARFGVAVPVVPRFGSSTPWGRR